MDERVEPNIRFHAYKELAQYIYPKRKALEHSGEIAGHTPGGVVRGVGAKLLDATSRILSLIRTKQTPVRAHDMRSGYALLV
jgi:hypothetical protein